MQQKIYKIKPLRSSKKVINLLNASQKELSKFFNLNISLPNVFLLDTRKQFDQVWNMKSRPWMTGGANGNNIFILDPRIYIEESCHKNKDHFYSTLKHEYAHIAIRKFCGHNRPKWLNEGLACYLADQVKRQPTSTETLKVFRYFKKSNWQIYNISYFWVKLLLKKFGKFKILKLLKSINYFTTEKQFADIFYQIYKIKYTKKDFKRLLDEK